MNDKKTETTETKQVPKDLQTAYQVHTLAQIIYGKLASTHPWLANPAPPSTYSEPLGWPPMSVGPPSMAWGGPASWTY